MNRNQKIAVGCGAAGCLVLIVVVIVGCIAFFAMRSSGVGTNRNLGSGINRGSARNANASAEENSNSNPQSATSEESSSSSMSNDARHKLWQAAGATQDTELMQRVMRKLNLLKEDGSTTDEYATFLKDHIAWALRNVEFMQSINTTEKARAYVEAHIND
jgi:hypothetical protein